jgi:ABC-type uncharacterized transport system involved in gliding motility auxiliary subunit
MRRSQSLIGLVGLILLFFGLASLLLTGELGAYQVLHLAGGIGLLGWFLVASFRDLGSVLSARSTRYGANMIVYSALFLLLLAAVNWLGVRYNQRIDLSEEGVFSLSPQARSIVEDLDQDIALQAFLEGGHDPAIEDLLGSFGSGSPRVKIELIDPDAQPDLAQKYGIRNYGTVRVAYGEQSTMVSQPSEESITNALIKVTHAKPRNVYFLQGQGEPEIEDLNDPRGYGQAKQDLENESYVARPLVLLQEGSVPADADIVVVAAPEKKLLDQEVGALRDYLARGGKAVFLLAPQTGEELAPLLRDYGIVLGKDVVVDEVLRLFEGPQLGMNPIVTTYGAHPITESFTERTIFPVTRSVTPLEGAPAGLTVTSIAKTSQTSWAEVDLETLFGKGQATLEEGADTAGPVSIAAASTADLAALGRGEGEARVVVYGTAGFAENKYLNMVFNRELFLNTFGWLAGQEELISVRPRTVRMSRVLFSEEQAATIFYLSVLVLPEILLVIGLAVWWRRSSL